MVFNVKSWKCPPVEGIANKGIAALMMFGKEALPVK